MVSRVFPAHHPRKGEPTEFVEKIWEALEPWAYVGRYRAALPNEYDKFETNEFDKKLHTIRAGSRWQAGDMASLRVWSDKPYRSKQIEFAQVEVKRVYPVDIYFTGGEMRVMIDGNIHNNRELIAKNDGLELGDFYGWFQKPMDGQIICWGDPRY